MKLKINPKAENRNGFPDPIPANCFKCQKQFWIKFVVPQRDYSKKNNMGYWSEKKSDKNKSICNSCLRSFYLDKSVYLKTVKDDTKRRMLSVYVTRDGY